MSGLPSEKNEHLGTRTAGACDPSAPVRSGERGCVRDEVKVRLALVLSVKTPFHNEVEHGRPPDHTPGRQECKTDCKASARKQTRLDAMRPVIVCGSHDIGFLQAAFCSLEFEDVIFLHPRHRLHHALGFLWIGIGQQVSTSPCAPAIHHKRGSLREKRISCTRLEPQSPGL